MCLNIRVHFDGRAFIPDEPVDLPLNQPLNADIREVGPGAPTNGLAIDPVAIRERLSKLDALNGLLPGPVIPLDALRRENLYDDRA